MRWIGSGHGQRYKNVQIMAISTFYTLNTTNRNSIRTFVDIVDTIGIVDAVDISWCQRVWRGGAGDE